MPKDRVAKERKTKPVHYRARHKKLRHLQEEVTEHGFKERFKVEEPQSQASEPKYCGVLDSTLQIRVIKLTRKNYGSAPSELDDTVHNSSGSTPTTSSNITQSPEIYSSRLNSRSRPIQNMFPGSTITDDRSHFERFQLLQQHTAPMPETFHSFYPSLPSEREYDVDVLYQEARQRVSGGSYADPYVQELQPLSAGWIVGNIGERVQDTTLFEYGLPTSTSQTRDLADGSMDVNNLGPGIVSGGLPMIPNHVEQMQTLLFPSHNHTIAPQPYFFNAADMPSSSPSQTPKEYGPQFLSFPPTQGQY